MNIINKIDALTEEYINITGENEVKIESENDTIMKNKGLKQVNDEIKFSDKYGNISIKKRLLEDIIKSMIDSDKSYLTNYFEKRKIEEKFRKDILSSHKCPNSYIVIERIITLLLDYKLIDNYSANKKSMYVVKDKEKLIEWINNI